MDVERVANVTTDIIVHSLRQTYLFDGWEYAPAEDRDAVADILVKLGYNDPRDEAE